MTDIVDGAENLIRASGWEAGHIVVRLVAALKASRVETQRLRADAEMWRGTQSMYRAMDKR